MVRSVAYSVIILTVLLICDACTINPVWKLNYLNKHQNHILPLTEGCYYRLGNNDYSSKSYIQFYVFFKNGLIKYGATNFDGTTSIESIILEGLTKEYYKRPYSWKTYVIQEDTILMEYFSPTYVPFRFINKNVGVLKDDSTLLILNRIMKDTVLKINQVYKFLPFDTPPDSTGYLYDKLQKKRAREMKKKKRDSQ